MSDAASLNAALIESTVASFSNTAVGLGYTGQISIGHGAFMAIGGYTTAILMANHGVVVCGERIDYAYDDLYYLERACAVQVIAQSTGRALRPVAELSTTGWRSVAVPSTAALAGYYLLACADDTTKVTETNETPWASNSSTSLAKSAKERVRRSTL